VSEPTKAEPDIEIQPIVGRKKKQKKEKAKSSTPATPAAEPPKQQPEPPVTAANKEGKPQQEESSTYRSTANEITTLTEEIPQVKPQAQEPEEDESKAAAKVEDAAPSKGDELPTAASTLQDLKKSGYFTGGMEDPTFFKNIEAMSSYEAGREFDSAGRQRLREDELLTMEAMMPGRSMISEEDQQAILAGGAVSKTYDGIRIFLTPNGDCLRELSQEEEMKFLHLQGRIGAAAGKPTTFVSERHEPATGFSLIKGRAVPNGPPGYFPAAPGSYALDPVTRIQRDEAIYYINQYVLPRLNLGTANLGFPGSWKSAFPDGKFNVTATSANINSIAPWIYGSNTFALPDDTAPPELSYPAPSGGLESMLEMAPGTDGAFHLPAMDVTGSDKQPPTMVPGPFGSVALMSVEDAEQALEASRRDTLKLEENLNQLITKNRPLYSLNEPVGGRH
jgi:CCR4-NOT transcription complex subunit 4